MEIATVTTAGKNDLLASLRGLLGAADEALLCVAFVQSAGVHLLRQPLKALRSRTRLLLTTVFTPNTAALGELHGYGTQLGIFNAPGGTYHPKVFLARSGNRAAAFIGSANLTGGLVNNVEAGVLMTGDLDDEPIGRAWSWAESLWSDSRRQVWQPVSAPPIEEVLESGLLAAIEAAVQTANDVIMTLGPTPRPNRIAAVTPSGVYVETDASRAKGTGPQLVPAWMITLAWDYLRMHGELSVRYLLATDGLNVKRSSAVAALLARLPGVTSTWNAREGIVLRTEGTAP